MTKYIKVATIALSTLLGAGSLAAVTPAVADQAKSTTAESAAMDAVAKVAEKAKDDAIIKTVDDAFKAMREIQAARLAIFNGSTDDAAKFVGEARLNMQHAQEQAKAFEIKTAKPAHKGDAYVPFDTSLTLAEGFKPTEEKQASINKANEHLAKGSHKEAVEVLKAANIDVVVTAALIPVNASISHIDDAVKLMKEKKYYEANLALKAVQDSVIVDSYGIDTIPIQG